MEESKSGRRFDYKEDETFAEDHRNIDMDNYIQNDLQILLPNEEDGNQGEEYFVCTKCSRGQWIIGYKTKFAQSPIICSFF